MKSKTKEILSIVLRVAVAGVIFAAVVMNYDTLKNLDLRGLVASIDVIRYAYLAVIGIYALKSVVFVVPAMMIYVSCCLILQDLSSRSLSPISSGNFSAENTCQGFSKKTRAEESFLI